MNKELQALEQIGAEKLARGELIRNDDKLEPYIGIIKQALQRLESIDNANPSEALESLEEIENYCEWSEFNSCLSHDFPKEYNTIKQALIKAQMQEKVLSIIKEKDVDIKLLKLSTTWLDYYTRVKHKTGYDTELIEEEFDLLKRWLG